MTGLSELPRCRIFDNSTSSNANFVLLQGGSKSDPFYLSTRQISRTHLQENSWTHSSRALQSEMENYEPVVQEEFCPLIHGNQSLEPSVEIDVEMVELNIFGAVFLKCFLLPPKRRLIYQCSKHPLHLPYWILHFHSTLTPHKLVTTLRIRIRNTIEYQKHSNKTIKYDSRTRKVVANSTGRVRKVQQAAGKDLFCTELDLEVVDPAVQSSYLRNQLMKNPCITWRRRQRFILFSDVICLHEYLLSARLWHGSIVMDSHCLVFPFTFKC